MFSRKYASEEGCRSHLCTIVVVLSCQSVWTFVDLLIAAALTWTVCEKASVVKFIVGSLGGVGLTSDPFLTLLRPCGLVARNSNRFKDQSLHKVEAAARWFVVAV